jgi:hypothetical protein
MHSFDRSAAIDMVTDQMLKEPLFTEGIVEHYVPVDFTPDQCLAYAAGIHFVMKWLDNGSLGDELMIEIEAMREVAACAADRFLGAELEETAA